MSSTALAPPRAASTPTKQPPKTQTTDSPGNWIHPRLPEIAKRQNATVFSEKNIRTIIYNVIALLAVVVLHHGLKRSGILHRLDRDSQTYVWWAYWALRLVPFSNILVALVPLLRAKDDMSDIPLTPGQRRLLGLPPSSAPPTPGSAYSTPPKYSRTPSMSGSVASHKSYGSSPLSGSPAMNASGFSPVASPLLQKAMAGGSGGRRRSSLGSLGSPSPLGASTANSLFAEAPSSPSPTPGKRSSVGLNNKWLYDKQRRSSGNNWL